MASLCSGFGVGAQPEVGATEALDQSTAAAPRSAGAALAEGAARRVPPLSPALCDGVGAALRDEQPKLASPQVTACTTRDNRLPATKLDFIVNHTLNILNTNVMSYVLSVFVLVSTVNSL